MKGPPVSLDCWPRLIQPQAPQCQAFQLHPHLQSVLAPPSRALDTEVPHGLAVGKRALQPPSQDSLAINLSKAGKKSVDAAVSSLVGRGGAHPAGLVVGAVASGSFQKTEFPLHWEFSQLQ